MPTVEWDMVLRHHFPGNLNTYDYVFIIRKIPVYQMNQTGL
jgi:hypothetical protein